LSASDLRSNAAEPRLRLALPVSIALHLLLIYGVSREASPVPEARSVSPTIVVRLSDKIPDRRTPAAPIPDDSPVEPPPPDDVPTAAPEEVVRAPMEVSEERETNLQVPAPDPITPIENGETLPPPTTPDDGVAQTDEPTPDIDWEAQRRRAITTVLEQRERERNYLTFSTDDLIDEPLADETAEPRESILDAPSRRPSAMQPGKSRTAFGRWAGSICNDLTGGISLFGIASLCADAAPAADYFGHLRPAYMEKKPECTEIELGQAAVDVTGNPAARTTIKCRLVLPEE